MKNAVQIILFNRDPHNMGYEKGFFDYIFQDMDMEEDEYRTIEGQEPITSNEDDCLLLSKEAQDTIMQNIIESNRLNGI